MRAVITFFRSRIFAFIRKLIFLFILIVLYKGSASIDMQLLSKFLIFFLGYSSIYAFNDIMDYEEDVERKKNRVSKILARGEISLQDYVALGAGLLAFSILLALFVFSRRETAILLFCILLGILRSKLKNLMLRTVSLFLLELLNLYLFSLFLSILPNFLFLILISALYSANYYIYRKSEMNKAYINLYIPVEILLAILCFFLPFPFLHRLYLALTVVIMLEGWRRSLLENSHKPTIFAGLLFLFLSLLIYLL